MANKFAFKGDPEAAYVNGVPARNLSEEDYDALSPELRKAVQASPLYGAVGNDPKPPKAAEGKKGGEG